MFGSLVRGGSWCWEVNGCGKFVADVMIGFRLFLSMWSN